MAMAPMKLPSLRIKLHPRDWIILALCIGGVVAMGTAIHPRLAPEIDREILDWVGLHLKGRIGDLLVQVYRMSGVGFTAFLVLAALIYLILQRWWHDLLLMVTASGGILLIVDLWLKPLFDRARPGEKLLSVDGRSFPSGHAAGAVAFYGAIVVILALHHPRLRRPLTIAAGLWVLLVWLSTLDVRGHWPSDLLAGALVGTAWLTVALGLWRGSAPAPTDPNS